MNGKKGTFNPGNEVLGENGTCFIVAIVGPTDQEYSVSVADTEEEYFFDVADFFTEYRGTLEQEALHMLSHVADLDFCVGDPDIKIIEP
jgi:hypothetical protein